MTKRRLLSTLAAGTLGLLLLAEPAAAWCVDRDDSGQCRLEGLWGTCLLRYRGQTYAHGKCYIEREKGGDFSINSQQNLSFARVHVSRGHPGIGKAYSVIGEEQTHVEKSHGTVSRHGACWSNDQTEICAWREPARAGRCLLRVDQKDLISGDCSIEMDKDGSFTIYLSDRRNEYYAYVNLRPENPKTAAFDWAGPDGRAALATGTLTRHGACWENDDAKVCAWRK